MSIHVDYSRTFNMGNRGEEIVTNVFRSKGWQVKGLDFRQVQADLMATKGERIEVIEVKTHRGGYPTFPAEVWQSATEKRKGIRPQYLRPDCPATIIIQINMLTQKLYIFDAEKLREYVLANEDLAFHFRNSYSSEGLKVRWKDKDAGFLLELDWKGM